MHISIKKSEQQITSKEDKSVTTTNKHTHQ